MSRHARIEIRPADVKYVEETDEQGRVWTDAPTPARRPHYLLLRGANNKILATSETYASVSNARRAVDAWESAFCAAFGARLEDDRRVVELDIDGNARP